ncbi:MAG: guanine-specific ribonuclease N1 and T1 [Chloroflexi bacterium]|nr:guanine-specific ribonuclease N1 and T1 [Chloroflexota bacterium]
MAGCGAAATSSGSNPAAAPTQTATQQGVPAPNPSQAATQPPARNPTPTPTRRPVPTATAEKQDGLPTIAQDKLTPEARRTISLIQKGGPFPHSQDGIVFQNREGLLPARASGYYHEYTVETPGASDRGARRIITGRGGEFYYTDDHYDSFKRVVMQP